MDLLGETGRIEDRRWYYVTLVAGAIAIATSTARPSR
jgi:hypothetical protein